MTRPPVFIVCLVNLNEAVSGNIIWPILPFLVARYTSNVVDVGMYVGLLGSSYFFGQVLCIRHWGWAADKFGRKPVLIAGLIGSFATLLWFGFSRSYTEAILSRFLCGAVNGNVAITKVYVGEVTDRENQALGFSWLSLTWGLGTLVAPALGGFLSDPPPGSFLDSPLTRAFPYSIPCLISAGFSLFALVLAIYLLKETPTWVKRNQGTTYEKLDLAEGGSGEMEEEDDDGKVEESQFDEAGKNAEIKEEVWFDSDLDDEIEDAMDEEGKEKKCGVSLNEVSSTVIRVRVPTGTADSPGDETVEELMSGTPSKTKHELPGAPSSLITPESSTLAVMRDKLVGPAIYAYCALAFLQVLFDELLPVFCSTSKNLGGLSWSSEDIGGIQIVNGVVQITANLFLVPLLQRKMGMLGSFRLFVLVLMPFFIAFPFVSRLNPWPIALYSTMAVSIGLRTLLFALPFSSIMIIINNLSPPQSLGLVVGIAQAAASAIRTVGPTLGGGLFSASIAMDWLGTWRLQGVYVLQALLALTTYVLSWRVSSKCEEPPVVDGLIGARVGKVKKGPNASADMQADERDDWQQGVHSEEESCDSVFDSISEASWSTD